MEFWRVTYRHDDDDHGGFSFHETEKEADEAAAIFIDAYAGETCGTDVAGFDSGAVRSRRQLVNLLRRFASHPDNG